MMIEMMIIPKYHISTTSDEENYETEDPIETTKPSPSVVTQNDTDLPSPIDAVPIVATRAPVFPRA